MQLFATCGHEFTWPDNQVAPDSVKCAYCGRTVAVYGVDLKRPRQSPQREWKCACPQWSSARQCYCLRYAPDDSMPKDEACDCACHDEPGED